MDEKTAFKSEVNFQTSLALCINFDLFCLTGPECRPNGVPRGGSEHPAAADGARLLCLHSEGWTTARLVLVGLPSSPEPVPTLPQGTQALEIL